MAMLNNQRVPHENLPEIGIPIIGASEMTISNYCLIPITISLSIPITIRMAL